ncbi:MAG TPA: RNB domain-containing ribonuclease, partial [Halioglobus sp.]
IEPTEKLLSQKLVEECMVAANRCAARFLIAQQVTGPFVSHPGFRTDRLDEVRKFLTLHAPALLDLDPGTVAGYRGIMRGLAAPGHALPLRLMINRLLTRAELTTEPAPHMGMALDSYTNCTSPLRKYVDFLVHMQIKAALRGVKAQLVNPQMLKELQQRLTLSRSATLEAERWLAGNYLAKLTSEQPVVFGASISHISSSGFTVRLDDSGLAGFVDLRKDPEKFSYDKWTASLTSTTRRFQLSQAVKLTFLGVDKESAYQALFQPVAGCGLKTVMETS